VNQTIQPSIIRKVQDCEHIYIISAPSGTGKTTISRKLVSGIPSLELSISHTTRKKRPRENNGDHYWFITKEEFTQMIDSNVMLEWAEIFGQRYGTSYHELNRIITNQHKVLMEIDVQGWHIARGKFNSARSILLMPPSIEELWKRLDLRDTDSSDLKKTRFNTAKEELKFAQDFHHFVINKDLHKAYQEIYDFIVHSVPMKLSQDEGLRHSQKLLEDLQKGLKL